ncbi:MAG: CotH kinase family protein [Planctomycetota bacterium]|nr:CotH kinase family protein [Planctomycetota bacterium]
MIATLRPLSSRSRLATLAVVGSLFAACERSPAPAPVPPRGAAPPPPTASRLPEAVRPEAVRPEAPLPAADAEKLLTRIDPLRFASGVVVVNEIHDRPPSGASRDEWVELYGRSDDSVDLSGWRLEGSVQMTFPPGTRLGPRSFLVVGAGAEHLGTSLGIDNVIGGWHGSLLSADGSLRLVDASGRTVETLRYGRGSPLFSGARLKGRSLERRDADIAADLAANWGVCRTRGWVRVTASGRAASRTLYFYLLGAGTAYVDDVELRPLGRSSARRAALDFEGNRVPLAATGTHGTSSVTLEEPHGGKRCLRVNARGPGASRGDAVVWDDLPITVGEPYELVFWVRFAAGAPSLVARLSGSRPGATGIHAQSAPVSSTPGAANSQRSTALPPHIREVTHRPRWPTAGEEVTVRAAVAAYRSLKALTLHHGPRGDENRATLLDNGGPASGDEVAGDGIYSTRLRAGAAGSLVRYHVSAVDERGGRARFPGADGPTRQLGFHVRDPAHRSEFPMYHVLIDDSHVRELMRNPYSDVYRPATFVHDGDVYCDVGVRYRGQTSRSLPKRHWKVKFNKDRPFVPRPGHAPVTTVNLNSSYGDKIFLRETLGYGLWRDLGEAHCETWYARLYVNGKYHGFYIYLENPGGSYLRRNGLEAGWLWKAYSGGRSRGEVAGFELEEGEPLPGSERLADFLQSINSLSGAQLDETIREHMNVDSFINFLVACQLVHSADHVEKNYLVYADPDGRFTFLPWDLDLTHGRNYECRRGGIWNDRIRHDLWDEDYGDEELLFGTRLHPKCDSRRHYNGVIDAFLRRTASFRPLYHARLAECLARYYHPDVLIPRARELKERIRDEVLRDRKLWGTYGGDGDFDRRFELFLDWVRKRYTHLRQKLEGLGYDVER